jgi:hypothetical protein
MPGMNGLELQAALNRRQPPMPVIILTACEDVDLRARAVTAGAAMVLRKPCDSMLLLRAVAEAAGQPVPALTASNGSGGSGGCSGARGDDPDNFILEAGHAVYRLAGSVSFDKAVALVRGGIAAARRHQVRDLLVDTTALTGFPSPDTLERFLAAVDWAQEAAGGVRLALVAREEMIHPEKFGILVARNRGLISNIFPTEEEARAWLGW